MLDEGGSAWQDALKGHHFPRTRKETEVYLSGVHPSVDLGHEKNEGIEVAIYQGDTVVSALSSKSDVTSLAQ
jgi:hypothetical protein